MAPIPITRAEYAAKFGGATSVSAAPIPITRAEYAAKFNKPEVSKGYQPEGTLTDTLLNLGGAANRAADMGTFGLTTKAGSGISALLSKLGGDDRSLGDLYDVARAENEASMENLPVAAKVLSSGVGLAGGSGVNLLKTVGLANKIDKVSKVGRLGVEGALQSGLSAYGHDQEVLPAMGVGGVISAGLGTAGKVAGVAANKAGDLAEATKNKLFGLRYSDIKKSLGRDVRALGETEAPIIKAVDRLSKQGAIKAGEAVDNFNAVETQIQELGGQVKSVLKAADDVQPDILIPQYSATESYVSKLDSDARAKATEIYHRLKQAQSNNILLSDWELEKSALQRAGANTYGMQGADAVEANLKKYMAKDIKDAVDGELANPLYQQALGDKFQDIQKLRSGMADRFRVRDAFAAAATRESTQDADSLITGILRTTGGYGVPMLIGAGAGEATGTGALAGAAAGLALRSNTGKKALVKLFQAGESAGKPLAQLAQQLAPMAGRLSADAKAQQETPEAKPTTKAEPLSYLKQEIGKVSKKADSNKSVLLDELASAGITDQAEVNQFLAQMDHESAGFKKLKEVGSGSRYEGRKDLGNTQKGDGEKFKGRGFIQLTGRANYEKYGKKIGVDLVSNPELAEDPKVAAKIAIAYWSDRVKPKITDFNDVKAVTKIINGGFNGLSDREKRFSKYSKESKTLVALLQEIADKGQG